jgi:hypothetical protein
MKESCNTGREFYAKILDYVCTCARTVGSALISPLLVGT